MLDGFPHAPRHEATGFRLPELYLAVEVDVCLGSLPSFKCTVVDLACRNQRLLPTAGAKEKAPGDIWRVKATQLMMGSDHREPLALGKSRTLASHETPSKRVRPTGLPRPPE